MSNRLYYKGYYTDVTFDAEDQSLHGVIVGIKDFVNYVSYDAKQVEKEFHKAVDDYLEYCDEIGKEPDKPYSGVFQVRVTPEIHRSIAEHARKEHSTINAVIKQTLQKAFG